MSVNLPFFMERQTQSQWNWAAVAASILRYYKPSSPITQCSLANWAFGQTNCCIPMSASSPSCNRPMGLSQTLSYCGVLNSVIQGALSFYNIKAQIDAGVSIHWTGSVTGHCAVITGYDESNPVMPTIQISDSWYGDTVLYYSNFPANYQGGGTWAQTYLTQG